MRYYVPEPPRFRLFKQKPACLTLPIPAPVDFGRDAPKSKDDIGREQAVKQASTNAPPRPNDRAHRFLDQVEAVHRWWTAPVPANATSTAPAASSGKSVAPAEKPLELLDLQDLPEAKQARGYKLAPALMRQWFGNPAYAVESEDQKACLPGAPLYPATLVNATTLNLSELLQVERIQAAFNKIKSQEFLDSKPVRDALYKVCSRLPAEAVDVDPGQEFGGDLQRMHRKYAFAAVTVGKRFLQGAEDIRVHDLDTSGDVVDDLALALGQFRLHVAIQDAHVFYNGRTTRRVQVKEVAIYIMAPYGFDAFGPDVPYLGHFTKKHFALVTDGDWVPTPVYIGRDMHAKNAVLRPATKALFLQWRQKHNKGGDMLLFSERRPSFPSIDVVVPLRPIHPRFALLGRIAANPIGAIGRPHTDLHFTLALFDTEWGNLCIDGQPTYFEAGIQNRLLIRSNFYYESLPSQVEIEQTLTPPSGMEPEEFARRLYRNAQSFASYTEIYSTPSPIRGPAMKLGEYNSNSYIAGLLHSVMGAIPSIGLVGQDGTVYQAPGLEMPLPDSYFRNAP